MINIQRQIAELVKTDYFSSFHIDVRFSNGLLIAWDTEKSGHGQFAGITDNKENYFYIRVVEDPIATDKRISACGLTMMKSKLRLVAVSHDSNVYDLGGFVANRINAYKQRIKVTAKHYDYDKIYKDEMPEAKTVRKYDMNVIAVDFEIIFSEQLLIAKNPCDFADCLPSPVCPDATLKINSELFGTVSSGGVFNLHVIDTIGQQVGEEIDGQWVVPSADCPDATITVLSEAFQTVASGGSLDIILEFDDGSTPSFALDNDTIIIPLPVCPPPPSIELAVSIEAEPTQFEETTLTLTISGDVLDPADYGDYQFAITLGDGNVIMPPTAPLTIVQDGATVVATFSHSYGTAGVKNIFATVIDNNQGLTANASTTTDVQPADLLVQVHPTGARAIWSNFLRNVNYQGDFMRVRRDDNQVKNIPIEDGRAKTSEFLDFIGSGAGYATRVYSHINGFEWVQNDITNQPRVRVDSNELMWLDFEGRQGGARPQMSLELNGAVTTENTSVFTVTKFPLITSSGRSAMLDRNKFIEVAFSAGGTGERIEWGAIQGDLTFNTTNIFGKTLLLSMLLRDASNNSELYLNSDLKSSGIPVFGNRAEVTMGGRLQTNNRPWRERLFEVVEYSENNLLTRADIEDIIRASYLQLDSNFFDTI